MRTKMALGIGLTAILTATIVYATMTFMTPTITQKMKLKAVYTLQLYYASEMGTEYPSEWILVPDGGVELDWGEFEEGEGKRWYLKIINVGNVEANVCWKTTTFPPEWILEVDLSRIMTPEGETKPLAIGDEMICKLYLQENTAQAGVVYDFGIYFENHDVPQAP